MVWGTLGQIRPAVVTVSISQFRQHVKAQVPGWHFSGFDVDSSFTDTKRTRRADSAMRFIYAKTADTLAVREVQATRYNADPQK